MKDHSTAMLAGIEAMNQEKSKTTPIDFAKAIAIFTGYAHHYKDDTYEIIEAEAEREFPINSRSSNTEYKIYGKLDTIVKDGDKLVQLEHKTGQRDADSDGVYPFITANVSEQVTLYSMLMSSSGETLDHTLIDYIKVPTLRPKGIPAGDKDEESVGTRREIIEDGSYLGVEVGQSTQELYTMEPKAKENGECYLIRINQHIAENPEKYFARSVPIHRNNVDMVNELYAMELVVDDIEECQITGVDHFYKNTSQCLAYGSKCEYMGLCDGTSTEDNGDWEPRQGGNKKGSNKISFSKATCFKSCRRKFYYRYEQGIQKVGYDTQSLRIGSLFHVGVEFYFRSLIAQEKCNE